MSLRETHAVGRHVLAFADGGADWCRACGEFSCYLVADGKPTDCRAKPKKDRFWPQGGAREGG